MFYSVTRTRGSVSETGHASPPLLGVLTVLTVSLPPGDEMFSDAFRIKEVEGGFLYEVEGKVSHRNPFRRLLKLM